VALEKGKALFMIGDIVNGRNHLQIAVEQARLIGKRRLEGHAVGSLAFSYGEQGEAETYAALTRDALAIFEELDDQPLIASMLVNLGGALIKLARLEEAEDCYRRAREIATPLQIRHVEALCLAGQGSVLCHRGQVERGTEGYEKSNVILAELGNNFMVARHWFLAGRHALNAGLIERAEALLERSREAAEARNLVSLLWQIYESLAKLREAQERPKEALSWLRLRISSREKMLDERTEEQLKILRFTHRMEILKQEATLAATRSALLEQHNKLLQEALEREQQLRRQVEILATTDALTGLLNRRSWEQRAGEACRRSARSGRPVVVALLDIDHFKRVNDNHGHAVGDEVLATFAQYLRQIFRGTDLIGRYGGEEFCILFEGHSLEPAVVACERLLQHLQQNPIPTEGGPLRISTSIGLAGGDTVTRLLREADQALYRAKASGRNQVVVQAGQEGVEMSFN
jgi:diguanylate cyclase (GGDEF)-like protein